MMQAMVPNQQPGRPAQQGVPSRTKQHPAGAMMCSIHQKTRGPNNVEQTFPGSNQWKCKPGSECKLPANQVDVNKEQVPGTPAPIHPHEPATCWAHGKKRSPNQLHQVNTPFGAQWECLPQFKCKGAAGAPAPATAMPTAAAAAAAASGTPYPVPITGAPGLDSVTNAYLQHTMLMQHGMVNSMQLGIDQGMHERNPRHHRLQGV
eukprot:TRINITY_DN2007_c0_g1_i6.p1 TRINITY_DN2007_c0_g1~~TRINITY_DN2007_c0_g1_i6.p1  ORF type:complete len:205 (+),score=51.92 TRINITY_DN2007_c0_g1_i6:131-745(+)